MIILNIPNLPIPNKSARNRVISFDNTLLTLSYKTTTGFEALHALATHGNDETLSHFDADNLPVPLNLTKHAFESRLFDSLSKKLMQSLMFQVSYCYGIFTIQLKSLNFFIYNPLIPNTRNMKGQLGVIWAKYNHEPVKLL